MFLKGAWFIIAGVLLLGQTPAQAESYLRVSKNGVIYYHFANQAQPQLRRQIKTVNQPTNRTLPPGKAWIRKPGGRRNLPLPATKGLIQAGANFPLPAAVSPEAAGLTPLMPGNADDLPVVWPHEPQGNFWAAVPYPLKWLTKLGCYYSPALTACAGAAPRPGPHQQVPYLQEPPAVAADGRVNSLKYAQEQPSNLARVGSSPACLEGLNPNSYIFPVGGPFSFRDTWGEWRSGGRHHRAVDIFAGEGTEVYAITTGVIKTLATYPGAGTTLLMLGLDGRGYGYMHLQGYAAGIVTGQVVRTGELIGYVGRSGLRNSPAHLHLQVYADHRLGKNDLLNPYSFLVQLCQGRGVRDLHHQRIARLEDLPRNLKQIRVYRRSKVTALRRRSGQLNPKDSSIMVIKNF